MSAASEPVTASPLTGGLLTRTISAIVLAVPVLAAELAGPPWFTMVIVLAAVLMGWEWAQMCKRQTLWLCVGFVYIAFPAGSLIWLRGSGDYGAITVLWLFAVVWSADIGAYLVGRKLGGPKLAPRISPKKTWSGFVGGITLAAMSAALFAMYWDADLFSVALIGLVVAIASQIGDLMESAAKRHFGVKDSSNLIPGHGGVLDRVDALIVGALVLTVILMILGKDVMPWV